MARNGEESKRRFDACRPTAPVWSATRGLLQFVITVKDHERANGRRRM